MSMMERFTAEFEPADSFGRAVSACVHPAGIFATAISGKIA